MGLLNFFNFSQCSVAVSFINSFVVMRGVVLSGKLAFEFSEICVSISNFSVSPSYKEVYIFWQCSP